VPELETVRAGRETRSEAAFGFIVMWQVLPPRGGSLNDGIDQTASSQPSEPVDTGFSCATLSPRPVLHILAAVAASSFYRLMLSSVLQKNGQVKW
jgi:hypothetical protein